MLAYLQVDELKPIRIVTASEALTRGAVVAPGSTDKTVAKATATTGYGLVDIQKNYNGINAVIEPSDADFESIASGSLCLYIPLYPGERFATTEVTTTSLSAGDKVKATSGKFAKDSSGNCVYRGTYANPWGLDMYIIEVI